MNKPSDWIVTASWIITAVSILVIIVVTGFRMTSRKTVEIDLPEYTQDQGREGYDFLVSALKNQGWYAKADDHKEALYLSR